MIKQISLLLALIFLLTNSISAQIRKDSLLVDQSLSGQYKYLLSKSRTLEGYKVVNPVRMSNFWKNITDTLAANKKQLGSIRQKLNAAEKKTALLNSKIAELNNELTKSAEGANEISFLGIGFSKSSYSLAVWTIISVMAIALVFATFKSVRDVREAKYRNKLYEEISQELQNHKIKANEKEKKLARELQDERNKLDEMRNRGR